MTSALAPQNPKSKSQPTPPVAPAITPKATREKTGLSPEDMAALLGMSANGYRAWEAGSRSPGGPAWRLLALIAADPKGTTARLTAL